LQHLPVLSSQKAVAFILQVIFLKQCTVVGLKRPIESLNYSYGFLTVCGAAPLEQYRACIIFTSLRFILFKGPSEELTFVSNWARHLCLLFFPQRKEGF
jgi:hypothetical protein